MSIKPHISKKQSRSDETEITERVSKRYAVGITDHVRSTIKGDVTSDPIAKQYVPQLNELSILPEENPDPIGDDAHSPIKGIVHRHKNRVLFKIANVCAVYCRYCFRREMIGSKGGKPASIMNADERAAALSYIADHPEIQEVIFTGGDPLVVSARQIGHVLDALSEIEHVKIVRFHTRVPIADPVRVTPALCDVFRRYDKPIYVALHVNHAQEFTPLVSDTIKALHDVGCILLSQSVLLRGVNDDADTLSHLMNALLEHRVKPYYIHHPDLAPGTAHFRLGIEEGMKIMSDLRHKVSGMAMPHYMLDIPGGYGKVPLNHSYVEKTGEGQYLIEDQNGIIHHYSDE